MFLTANGTKSLAIVVSLLLLSSCSTARQSKAEPSSGKRSRSSRVITAEELADVFQFNALQAVELLRPTWLRNRGPVTMESSVSQGVRLYVDGNPRGLASDMEGILASDILEMRFLDSREATTRYGTGYPDGVIVITTRQH